MSARVKICGITTVEQGQFAVAAGADAIGLVFYAKSPRCVDLEQARAIALACGPFVTVTGLFVNAAASAIESILAKVPLHLLQFHGDETLSDCERFHRPYIKALRMRPELDLEASIAAYPSAVGILLDAYRPGTPGGTGETFDWQRVPTQPLKPIVLAGGLTPDNVSQAIATTRCNAVDVSGGVELGPGMKDPERVKNFIVNAKRGNL
ncbi:phosphoribosylanthranilate isomerase [Gilvimarinus sp. SDUM040013]|uniref:N-(5'-phosphoribosyl)anthranilate isomerase n=1 Tax=Gilvimarinus gilvus TaxID=3058038 RepID=A0ABU4RXT8_9GAMM|nr:phosphoribosylanthranilate isomerase [Gilvimarinus sp. SDUM040013]MDO3386440.1 phosphoribosylanthranilate isomerase [Gilvimarinus sp. SDUM040013]MDX6849706.1 phosphoribosylanthranilate isomerase [Gilvimarinus sp. SDUM040013]